MDLLQLQYFLVVSQQEHMTKSANILNISQPSLSIMINRLEKDLGHSLFERDGRNIKLNESGRKFREYIEPALMLIENGKNAVCEYKEDSTDEVHIATTGTWILKSFSIEHFACNPSIKLNVQRIFVDDLESYLNDNQTDFVLTSVAVEKPQYKSMFMFQEELMVVVNKDHPFAGRDNIDLLEMKNENWILPPTKYALRKNFDEIFSLANIKPKIVMECDHYTRIGMLSDSQTVTLAGHNALVQDIFPSEAVYIRIVNPVYKRSFYLVWNQKRQIPKFAFDVRDQMYQYCYANYNQ